MGKVTRIISRLWDTEPRGRISDAEAAVRDAAEDAAFQGHVARADAARDAGDWAVAEDHYARALAHHPLHPGYRIQLGHMLKEQGRLAAAELQYRTAWALGEANADLRRHLRFVCEAQGAKWAEPRMPPRAETGLRQAATVMDLEALAYLFWGQPADLEEPILRLMRRSPSCEDAALAMIADARFATGNRTFLEILGEAR